MYIVSFGTADGVYDSYIERLGRSCDAVGLRHDLEIIPAATRRVACLQKPDFILRKLRQHQQPVVWLDADAIVAKSFSLPETGWDIGLAPNTRWWRRGANPTSAFVVAVAPTEKGEQFIESWRYLCANAELTAVLDHKRLTWTREMRKDMYTEINLHKFIPGTIIRDFGRKKQARI
ncbi:hypothetical protein [Devosia sp.]|uniref:hypothetical protein n=1 Tax=Devosia sp. TaxID=1871048 RepID=UPI001AC438C8|nr:hypothetical protein [Devosia sp.]MBN9307902.1 hypothetical protein [Devosia sp.]